MKRLLTTLLLILCLCQFTLSAKKNVTTGPEKATLFTYQNCERTPLFSGHRGLQPFGPENSFPSFLAAAQKGLWAIETDFRLTKDHKVVCIHDATLERTTTGTGKVRDYTLKQIKELLIKPVNSSKGIKVLYDYSKFSPEQLRIPTMEEYFQICRRYGCVAFIELKEDDGIIDQMIENIKKYQMEGRCIISSSKMELLKAYRKKGNEFIHLIFAKPEDIDVMASMKNAGVAFNIKKLGVPVEGMEYHGRKLESVQQVVDLCHSLELRVCFRAVDNLAKAQKSIEIMTDYMPTNCMWEMRDSHLEYQGERIDLRKNIFSSSVFMKKSGYTKSQQGMDIYNDYIFILQNEGRCLVYDYRTRSSKPIGDFLLRSASKDNHSNCANFGIEKVEGASFPLLYVTVGKYRVPIEWTCHVESITLKDGAFSSELVQKIHLDASRWEEKGYKAIFGCPAWMIDRERKNIWIFSAKKRTLLKTTGDPSTNMYIATKFRLPKLSEGSEITLTADDILDQVTFPFDAYVTQAGCMRDGKIYYCFGFTRSKHPETPSKLRVYDTDTGKICSSIELEEVIAEEMEDISIYNEKMYINTNSPKLYEFSFR
ncbi:MAG: hypothetical protein KBS95_06790 [Alistipes sp.]|nr:hypothetical protein [Candidatus Alistipes equi]